MISASEASRNLSSVLNQAEHGETIVVTRAGRRVAHIVPAPRANGAALRDIFRRWQGSAGLDEELTANVDSARAVAAAYEDRNPSRG